VRRVQALLEEHGAFSLDKQDAIADYLGEHRWELDVEAGSIAFGQGREFDAQIIGTESKSAGTWLWAWANEASRIPVSQLRGALALRAYGRQNGVEEFVKAELPLEEIDGHRIGMVGVGLLGQDGYYLGHHPGGAVLVFLKSPALQTLPKPTAQRLSTIFSSFISGWDVFDQRSALVSYARAKRFQVAEALSGVDIVDPSGSKLSATFDDQGRLALMRVTLG
jgi:hypothetical protein